MQSISEQSPRQFNSPEEELAFLREQVRRREEELTNIKEREITPMESMMERQTGDSAREVIHEYGKELSASSDHIDPATESLIQELALLPETHDAKMSELITLVEEKGVRVALVAIEKLDNAHLQDDFHRMLARYIATGRQTSGLREGGRLWQALHMTLYEVILPEDSGEQGGQTRPLKELLSSMEQFYSGMLSVAQEGSKENNYFTVELSLPHAGEEVSFYSAVPTSKKDLFEKHVLSVFPNARLEERRDDYNIFNDNGVVAGARGKLVESPVLALRTYEHFDYDPLNIIVNAFSKIKREGEGAALQLVFKPEGEYFNKKYRGVIERLQKGEKRAEAFKLYEGFLGQTGLVAGEIFGMKKKDKPKEGELPQPPTIDTVAIEQVQNKISSVVVACNLRIVTSAETLFRAEELLTDLQSAFNQFEDTSGNKMRFERLRRVALRGMVRSFSFREYSKNSALPLSLKEVTTLVHFSGSNKEAAHQLKRSKSNTAPAPLGVSDQGILLGVNNYRGQSKEIHFAPEDRVRHFYCIGQTGTGKSTLIKNMIAQDIIEGRGVCMIDPHGSDIDDLLAIVPKERYDDVIYFNPGYTARPMALNMLEYDVNMPEQKTFVVNELFGIFRKLYAGTPESMGPAFEQYFRNATLLVMEHPESGATMLDISRVLADEKFRNLKLSHCSNPVVSQFWREIATKAGGEASLANIVPYITNKFDVFTANEIMRPIIAQEKSSFDFREIMDTKKIFLVNLAKGRIGDINSNLLGLVVVGKFLMAALSRVDSFGKDLPPFYLYLDEFQNITTDSIAIILSEARKYGLALSVAHQFIAQLTDNIRDAVFGNVGSLCAFRVGAEDAQVLEKHFSPAFKAHDLMNIENRNAFVRLLANGSPVNPFSIETLPPPQGRPEHVESLKELSYMRYGRARADIDREISDRYGL